MDTALTPEELDLLLESLSYTKRAFRDYDHYSPEFKQEQVERVEKLMAKLKAMRAEAEP